MSKCEKAYRATAGQIESIAAGIEQLAGDEMIGFLEMRAKNTTMELTSRWHLSDGIPYQAQRLQTNSPNTEQVRWRLDKFKRIGTKTIEVIQRSELQVDQYTSGGSNRIINHASKQSPAEFLFNNGKKVLHAHQLYFGHAGQLLSSDMEDVYASLKATARSAQAEFDRDQFQNILYTASNKGPDEAVPLFSSGPSSVGVFRAFLALAKIRHLQRTAVRIEQPNGLPK